MKGTEFRAKRGRKPKYNWPLWTSGASFTVTHGVDFTPDPQVFMNYLHDRAGFLGLKASAERNGQTVTFRFFREVEAAK